MKRKFVLGLFLLLNLLFLATPSHAADELSYQTITESQAQELDIDIPPDTPPGYKSLEVKISGMDASTQFKRILFCKDQKGIIHWDNICPDLIGFASQSDLESAKTRSDLPEYDPLSNPDKTVNTVIIGFAALTVLLGAGALSNNILQPIPSESNSHGYLAQLSKGVAVVAGGQLGRGDKSRLWNRPINQRIDSTVSRTGSRISGFSPVGTRILADGNYQRALIGPFSLLFYPLSIALGIFSSRSINNEALPPALGWILVMMVLGVMDALAGVLVSLAFALSVIIGGNVTDLDSALTVAGVSLLAFSPALLAGAFRPFRRPVWDFTSLWERGTDYLLASVLTGWVVQQIVLGLPGLAGLQLPLTIHARTIGLFAAALIILRFALEDLSTRLFPQRLNNLEPQYHQRAMLQQIFSVFFKVVLFGVIAGKFVGVSTELFIGISLFSLPLIMGVFEDRFPKSISLQKWMPSGIIEMLVMTISGYFLAIMLRDRYPDARTYVLASFVLLSLPGLFLSLLALFGKEGARDWKITKIGALTYRILGVIALGTLIYIILSGLLLSGKV